MQQSIWRTRKVLGIRSKSETDSIVTRYKMSAYEEEHLVISNRSVVRLPLDSRPPNHDTDTLY